VLCPVVRPALQWLRRLSQRVLGAAPPEDDIAGIIVSGARHLWSPPGPGNAAWDLWTHLRLQYCFAVWTLTTRRNRTGRSFDSAAVVAVAAAALERAIRHDWLRLSVAAERLPDERGQHAAVVETHARAEGVEDADDARLQAVVGVVGHGERLLEAFGLVVYTARADGVHIAPVGLALRMLRRISVNLAGARVENAGLQAFGKSKHIDCTMHTSLSSLYWIILIVDRGCRAG
jgi:hypothetical protein